MKEFEFKKIDAFATAHSTGNPAGYIKLHSKDSITENEMLRIARELKGFVSEVGYAYADDEDIVHLKYYSSEREVEFCGHATIAIMYDIIKNTDSFFNKREITIENNKGRLSVENMISTNDAVFIMSPLPEFLNTQFTKVDIAAALDIDTSTISGKYPISLINAGLNTLLVPIELLESALSINPDMNTLKKFCQDKKIDIIEIFCGEVYGSTSNFRTRVFAPTFGYLEDPATGSGNSAFGYYLMKLNIWDGNLLIIEQNGSLKNGNIVQLSTKPDMFGNTRVLFGGGAVTRLIGKYILI